MRASSRYMDRQRKTRRTEMKKNIAVVVVIVVFGVFVFSVNAVGKFMAEKVVAPVLNFVIVHPTQTPEPGTTPDTTKVSQTIKVPAFQLFAIQMGAYSDSKNAETQKASLQAAGGGGYIVKADYYRVLASGYLTEEEAQQVQEQLKAQGQTCSVYTLQCDELAFKITATKEQIEIIDDAFQTYPQLCTELIEACLAFDRSEKTETELKTEMKGILDDIKAQKKALEDMGGSGENKPLAALTDIYARAETSLEEICGQDANSSLAFSVRIKYNYMEMTDAFCQYENAIT